MALHLGVLVIRGLPVGIYLLLGIGQGNLPRANQALQLDLDPVFAVRPVFAIPRLKLQIFRIARTSAERERDNVVKLIVGYAGRRYIALPHESALDLVGVADWRAHVLGIALCAHGRLDIFLRDR